MKQAPLWLMHCDVHLDPQGDQIPCPGHYLRGHVNVKYQDDDEVRRIPAGPGGHAVVTGWGKVDV